MTETKTFLFEELSDRTPIAYQINGLDLVFVRYDDNISVLYGRCLHRGALLADGFIQGDNLICGLHGWDFRYDTGVSEYDNSEVLYKFKAEIKDGYVCIDEDEINLQKIVTLVQFLRQKPLDTLLPNLHLTILINYFILIKKQSPLQRMRIERIVT
ncbi:MAG: Rieske 2Fe-2S domain-containing protein [Saprospiraceae bacterium]|nr:Rieske 2Fe-2S domain-containing protein [Saprospiraceae bacterium]